MLDSTILVGQLLGQGRYRVKKKLGEGGMAFVLLAFDKNVGIDVVLKMPKPEMLADSESTARFKREIRSMATLTHPNIVRIKDVGEQDGVPFYVMDLLPGGSLKDRFEITGEKRRPQSPESLADWLESVAKALDYSHRWFVHRDIKPDNILFDSSGNAFVSDFGIVKAISGGVDQKKQTLMTQAGIVFGTLAYIAPEIAEGEKYDGRVDQYALAATVYEVLAGRVPFDGNTLPAVIRQQLTGKVPPLRNLSSSLRDSLMPVIEKGLSWDPKNRYASCTAFAKAILAAIQSSNASNAKDIGKSKTIPKPAAHPALQIVCPSCRNKIIQFSPAVGEVICPVCQEELSFTKKPIERETKGSSASKAETQLLEQKKATHSPPSKQLRTLKQEKEFRRIYSRLMLIVIAVAVVFFGVLSLVALIEGSLRHGLLVLYVFILSCMYCALLLSAKMVNNRIFRRGSAGLVWPFVIALLIIFILLMTVIVDSAAWFIGGSVSFVGIAFTIVMTLLVGIGSWNTVRSARQVELKSRKKNPFTQVSLSVGIFLGFLGLTILLVVVLKLGGGQTKTTEPIIPNTQEHKTQKPSVKKNNPNQ